MKHTFLVFLALAVAAHADVKIESIALPMRDTVKQVGAEHRIERTVDRQPLWLAQTPQAFRLSVLRAARRDERIAAQLAGDATLSGSRA